MEMEQIKDQIPYYLTKEQGEGLLLELEKYNGKTSLYTGTHADSILQGDGWSGFQLFDFVSEKKQRVRGILLSNSCDIDPTNARSFAGKVTFAPIIRLGRFRAMLTENGVTEDRADNIIGAIRRQENTQFFYLPCQPPLDDEFLVWLSDIHSMPAEAFVSSSEKAKIFTLNLTGFYLFLLKLSIHFCRFHENVDRGIAVNRLN